MKTKASQGILSIKRDDSDNVFNSRDHIFHRRIHSGNNPTSALISRPIILLDIDETIVNSIDISTLCEKSITSERYSKGMRDLLEIFSHKIYEFTQIDDYCVFKRPHFDEFIDFLYDHFQVGIWSKGSSSYVVDIVTNFIDTDPRKSKSNNELLTIHTRRNCKYITKMYNNGVDDNKTQNDKQLHYLSELFPNRQIIIVDDRDIVGLNQQHRFIKIAPFKCLDAACRKDEELLRVKNILKEFI